MGGGLVQYRLTCVCEKRKLHEKKDEKEKSTKKVEKEKTTTKKKKVIIKSLFIGLVVI